MDYQKIYRKITDNYSEEILNWAVKKTGCRMDGEDLAQEVLCQIFIAVTREDSIEKLENFIWKVAYFVWCNKIRLLTKSKIELSIDTCSTLNMNTCFDEEIADRTILENELTHMRRKIANLSRIQREALILHYLDELSIHEVAERLNSTESAIKWHLFDARSKLKKELANMKDYNTYIYKPGKLTVGISGNKGPNPDTYRINESLIKQNICLLCYYEGKSIDELVKYTGVPRPYIEFDLDWLVNHEFIKLDRLKYYTTFYINDLKHRQAVGGIYKEYKAQYIDALLDYLKKYETMIRSIGFHGSDMQFERMLWSLITLYLEFISEKSPTCVRLGSNILRPIRPDGGNYYPLGCNVSEDQCKDPDEFIALRGWYNFKGVMLGFFDQNNWTIWAGTYTFSQNPFEFVGDNDIKAKNWHDLFCSLVKPDFDVHSVSDEVKEKLAKAVQNNWVTKVSDSYNPNFVILKSSEYNKLKKDIFLPIMNELEPMTIKMIDIFSDNLKKTLPTQIKINIDYFAYMDMYMLAYYALMFAAEDNMLLLPQTPEEGALFTLTMICED